MLEQRHTTLHGLVEGVCTQRPDAIAVDTPRRSITFGEFDAWANEIADDLLGAGVRPGDHVAVLGRLDERVLVAAYAVLKCGAAFVPITPDDPPLRARAVLEVAAPSAVVGAGPGGHTVTVSDGVRRDCRAPGLDVAADAAAYVLFTSGSMGTPKGVVVEHRNIVNYVCWAAAGQRVNGRVPTVPAVTPWGFDASMQQTFAPLARGDRVWLLDYDSARTPSALAAELAGRSGIGLHCTPTLWAEVLLAAVEDDRRLGLDALYLGGELVGADLWGRTRQHLGPSVRLANVYGPTETTVQACGGFAKDPAVRRGWVAVGRPIANASVHVVDASGAPVAPGAIGEVWIGGAGVARGYLGAAEHDRFSADPFDAASPTGRIFRTGDLGCLLQDGSVVVFGRVDEQVKIRGNRVELGEVEAALSGHPRVFRAGAAAVGGDRPRLRAVLVPSGPGSVDLSYLSAHLAERVPDYMVPTEVFTAASLPTSPNGKLDRARIAAAEPDPSWERVGTRAPTVEPTPAPGVAGVVARAWSQVLSVPAPAAGDDFFQLGGHSVLAARLIGRLRKALGVRLPLRLVFDEPTFEPFCAAVAACTIVEEPPAAELPTVAIGERVALTAEQRHVYDVERTIRPLPINNVLLAVRLTGALNDAALQQALDGLVVRHRSLASRFEEDGEGKPFQVLVPPAPVPLDRRDLSGENGDNRHDQSVRAARSFRGVPFDLAGEPLLRARVLSLGERSHILLLLTHHLVCDGMSLRLLMEDLLELYDAARSGRESRLPSVASYADFAASITTDDHTGTEQAVTAWVNELADADRRPVFPVEDGAAPPSYKVAVRRRYLDASTGLDGARGTPFMRLAAALAVVLHQEAGVARPLIGTVTAGRDGPEFERVVGPFASDLVVKVDLDGDPTLAEVAERTKEAVLRAFALPPVPFAFVARQLAATGGVASPVVLVVEPAAPPGTIDGLVMERAVDDREVGASEIAPAAPELTLLATRTATGWLLTVEHSEDALDGARVDALLDRLEHVLVEMLTSPERLISGTRADV